MENATLKKKKQVLLYYCVEMEDVARKIASESDSILLHSINWRFYSLSPPFLYLLLCLCIISLLSFLEFSVEKSKWVESRTE